MNADKSRCYAVTIKRTGSIDPTLEDTSEAISTVTRNFRKSGPLILVSDPIFEYDSRSRLHAHFTIRYRSFKYTRFQLKGWHLNYQELKTGNDLKKWTNYLNKAKLQVPLIQQRDATNYYRQHNGFEDV